MSGTRQLAQVIALPGAASVRVVQVVWHADCNAALQTIQFSPLRQARADAASSALKAQHVLERRPAFQAVAQAAVEFDEALAALFTAKQRKDAAYAFYQGIRDGDE